MKCRMLWQDFKKNKIIMGTLLLFMLLSVLTVTVAVSLAAELLGSVNTLFEHAKTPHFVQMHGGDVDQSAIDSFVDGSDLVLGQQTVELLNVAGRRITLGEGNVTEAASVMEIAFVTQNRDFDYLLDLSGGPAKVERGQVGVPVYYQQKNNLKVGDRVRVDCGTEVLELTVSGFIRDAQMNPSIVTSKRFLVSSEDWETIRETVGEREYLIEFLLKDPSAISEFEQQYAASGLPKEDTALTYSLYRLLNVLSDGLVIGIVLLIGFLLILISLLCLRYVILGALEEDVREIGIMKAIGLSVRDIRGIYLVKYLGLVSLAVAAGCGLSWPVSKVLLNNITRYMGTAKKSIWTVLLPPLSALLLFFLTFAAVRWVLRRLDGLSAAEALRAGTRRSIGNRARRVRLHSFPVLGINASLAVQDICLNIRSYLLLGFTYTVCVFLAVMPVNLYSTIRSPEFVTYMGAGISHIRIDLQSENPKNAYEKIASYLDTDPDVGKYAAFVTGTFPMKNSRGEWVTVKTETGDFSVFPVGYAEGRAPRTEEELSLSAMNADELGFGVGDLVTVLVDGTERELTVCGLYQDVTNGGKTAKALLPVDEHNILWYVVNLDVASGASVEAKKTQYASMFPEGRVLDMEDYLNQTLGVITDQVRLAAVGAVFLSTVVAVLITAMFFRMMLAKDSPQIAVMRSIGFSERDLAAQYAARAFILFFVSMLLGILGVWGLGQRFAGLLLSAMGASSIRFTVNPVVSYLLCPGLPACGVLWTVWQSSRAFGRGITISSITE